MENSVAEIIKAITRPAISIIFAVILAYAAIKCIQLPTWFLSMAIPCIAFWFGERAITHAKEKKGD